jgi:hypothetical protein
MWPFRRRPAPPDIPKFAPPAPIVVTVHEKPKDDGLVVEEVDTSAMTRTGVHKAWDRLRGVKP